ncbi:MAG: single-stranded-DNA-specific exonuclease RecJ [Clostridia bacterium]|nr:single-stranded-DNA-specific exonuclease RecJ [Clostridia bacterium]
MAMKKWVVAQHDRELAKRLAEECDIDPIAALIATSRGITDPTDLEQFFSDEPWFSNPLEMADIKKAAALLNEALEQGIPLAVFGDYDCDGVAATALLVRYLTARGANCRYRVPDRLTEGYGLNLAAVEEWAVDGVGLLITVDNGITCFEEIARAKELGMRVIVTDHHLPGDRLPAADAVVDPHRADCPSSFKQICGAQVAFSLICAAEDREPEELISSFADYLSVALIADVMPLIQENRCTVKYGLQKLKTAPAAGLSALISVAGLDRATLDARQIAFGIAPRINAAGRVGNAGRAVELLLTDKIGDALAIAGELDDWNADRQKIEQEITREAVGQIEEKGLAHDRVLVVAGEHWHSGVVGIVAARLTERYGCPSMVLSVEGETATGSGRSGEGFSLYEALTACREELVKFGGHARAAGLTLKTGNIVRFREAINRYADTVPVAPPVLRLDCKLAPSALSLDLAQAIEALEPFGAGNETPVFGVFGVTLDRITPLSGGKHLRLLFTKGQNTFQALLFGVTPETFCFEPGDLLDVAVTVESNRYRGELNLTVKVKGLRMSETDDDELFRQIGEYHRFLSGREYDRSTLLPTRAEIGEIYKFIGQKPVSEERIRYCFLCSLGYAKTQTALAVLSELGLLTQTEGGRYIKTDVREKTELGRSETYQRLTQGGANA